MTDPLGTVVVGFDGAPPAAEALRFGAAVASATGARLVAAFVWRCDEFDLEADTDWERFLEGVARRELTPAAEIAPAAELVPVGATSVTRGLHELAIQRDASMIVVGRTHRRAVGRMVPGSTAQRLIDGAPCAVAIPGHERPVRPGKVVVGYDGTPEADLALATATQLATAFGTPLQLVSVAEPPPAVPDIPGALQHARRRVIERRRLSQGERARAAAGPLSAEVSEAEGDPADVLVAETSPADLLVVGSREYGPVGAVLLGSVAADVMAKASCPVVVTPRAAPAPPAR